MDKPSSQKIKLTIAYEGTAYCGWQAQPNAETIQETIEKRLEVILKHKPSVTGAGRTDAGVHALGQVAHFCTDTPINERSLLASLNGLLPEDIRIVKVERIATDFHSRHLATNKIYHYHLSLGFVRDPFTRRYSWHLQNQLDLELLQTAANLFIGTHDFTSFANESHAGSASRNPIRTIDRLDVIHERTGVRLEFEGKSFLYKMVRNITGTLVEIASGKRSIKDIPIILNAKDRKKAGKAAPAQGLFLVRVDYPSASV